MSAARARILAALRPHDGPARTLPAAAWLSFADPVAAYTAALSGVGGRAVEVVRDDLRFALAALPQARQARRVCDLVTGLRTDSPCDRGTNPHTLADVDVAVVRGTLAVAENGAVWVADHDLPQRALPVLCQHLVLVVDRSCVVDHMHAAYERLAARGVPEGLFVAGPSKTADIEQSLVIGAHGARSLTVMLVGT